MDKSRTKGSRGKRYAAQRCKDNCDGRSHSFIGVDTVRDKIPRAATEVLGDWKESRTLVLTREDVEANRDTTTPVETSQCKTQMPRQLQ